MRHRVLVALLTVAALALLAVGATWLLGGFRPSSDPWPRVAVGHPVDVGQFDLAVTRATMASNDPSTGLPYADGALRVLLDLRLENTTDATAGYRGDLLLDVSADGRTFVRPTGTDGYAGDLQPGLPETRQIEVALPKGSSAPDEVFVVLSAQSYEWNNMINAGPDWGGSHRRNLVVVPVSPPGGSA
ncbi:MAG: hypothetical protein LWW86_05370 [Micrococcales bacterium]|nr:hypothetical protein [Micrococcales bacterium]